MKLLRAFIFILGALGFACASSAPEQATDLPSPVVVYITATPAPVTPSPTVTETESPTASPTPDSNAPSATVNKQAHCRYGPSVAYLHAADLYAGDKGTVRYRALYSKWLYVQFDKLTYSCWVAPSVVDVTGDVGALKQLDPDLQRIGSNMYGPPRNVQATRDGDEVTITWDRVKMTKDDDRGYLIEAFVCQDTFYIWWTDSYEDQYETSYTVIDEEGCAAPSYGKIYTVEKHGFSLPAEIPWPEH